MELLTQGGSRDPRELRVISGIAGVPGLRKCFLTEPPANPRLPKEAVLEWSIRGGSSPGRWKKDPPPKDESFPLRASVSCCQERLLISFTFQLCYQLPLLSLGQITSPTPG